MFGKTMTSAKEKFFPIRKGPVFCKRSKADTRTNSKPILFKKKKKRRASRVKTVFCAYLLPSSTPPIGWARAPQRFCSSPLQSRASPLLEPSIRNRWHHLHKVNNFRDQVKPDWWDLVRVRTLISAFYFHVFNCSCGIRAFCFMNLYQPPKIKKKKKIILCFCLKKRKIAI